MNRETNLCLACLRARKHARRHAETPYDEQQTAYVTCKGHAAIRSFQSAAREGNNGLNFDHASSLPEEADWAVHFLRDDLRGAWIDEFWRIITVSPFFVPQNQQGPEGLRSPFWAVGIVKIGALVPFDAYWEGEGVKAVTTDELEYGDRRWAVLAVELDLNSHDLHYVYDLIPRGSASVPLAIALQGAVGIDTDVKGGALTGGPEGRGTVLRRYRGRTRCPDCSNS